MQVGSHLDLVGKLSIWKNNKQTKKQQQKQPWEETKQRYTRTFLCLWCQEMNNYRCRVEVRWKLTSNAEAAHQVTPWREAQPRLFWAFMPFTQLSLLISRRSEPASKALDTSPQCWEQEGFLITRLWAAVFKVWTWVVRLRSFLCYHFNKSSNNKTEQICGVFMRLKNAVLSISLRAQKAKQAA